MASRASKLKAFRATLPPEDSELVICPPNCPEFHDHGKWPGAAAPPVKEESTPSQNLGFLHSREKCQFWMMMEDTRENPKPITRKQLENHARVHGADSVQGVADALGIEVDLSHAKASLRKPKKAKGVPRKVQAQQLLDRGESWESIEDVLDLNVATSKKLRSELNAYS